jgi:hypothetical protein
MATLRVIFMLFRIVAQKVTSGSLEGKVRRENTFVLNANRRSIWENGCDPCAFGFEDDAYAAQVVDGVGTDRAAQVSDEMWALSREPAGQSTH